jgi:multisubunit Na+/H+ antiporter MnhB subunit
MTPDRPPASEPDEPPAPEAPSAAADLEIWAEPTECLPARDVASAEVRYVIVTFGIMGTVAVTTAGVLLLLHSAPQLALAEVVLGLAAIILIATGGRWPEH